MAHIALFAGNSVAQLEAVLAKKDTASLSIPAPVKTSLHIRWAL